VPKRGYVALPESPRTRSPNSEISGLAADLTVSDYCNTQPYIVAADGIQHHNGVASLFDDQAPEVLDRVGEWQLRQYVTQRCVETLSHTTMVYTCRRKIITVGHSHGLTITFFISIR